MFPNQRSHKWLKFPEWTAKVILGIKSGSTVWPRCTQRGTPRHMSNFKIMLSNKSLLMKLQSPLQNPTRSITQTKPFYPNKTFDYYSAILSSSMNPKLFAICCEIFVHSVKVCCCDWSEWPTARQEIGGNSGKKRGTQDDSRCLREMPMRHRGSQIHKMKER